MERDQTRVAPGGMGDPVKLSEQRNVRVVTCNEHMANSKSRQMFLDAD